MTQRGGREDNSPCIANRSNWISSPIETEQSSWRPRQAKTPGHSANIGDSCTHIRRGTGLMLGKRARGLVAVYRIVYQRYAQTSGNIKAAHRAVTQVRVTDNNVVVEEEPYCRLSISQIAGPKYRAVGNADVTCIDDVDTVSYRKRSSRVTALQTVIRKIHARDGDIGGRG